MNQPKINSHHSASSRPPLSAFEKYLLRKVKKIKYWQVEKHVVPTSPRLSTPVTDLRHRTPVPDGKDGPRKVGPRYTYQGVGQSSDIGNMDPDIGDRHQTSPEEGEIGR